MKIKIPRIQKKIRIPRLRKQIRIPLIIGLVILLLALGMYFHLVPGPGDIAHMFAAKSIRSPGPVRRRCRCASQHDPCTTPYR